MWVREERQRNRRTGLSPQGLRPGIRQVAVGFSRTQDHHDPSTWVMPTWLLGKASLACLGQHQTQTMQCAQNPALSPGVALPRNQAGAAAVVAA